LSKAQRQFPTLLVPAALWYLVFLIVPMTIIVVYSFLHKAPYGDIQWIWNLENYRRALDPLYLSIVWESFKLAVVTALICLLVGYPVAYVLATIRNPYRSIMMVLLVIPFWTNLVVRTYAIKLLVADTGPINQFLLSLGLISEPLAMSNSYWAVLFGMVTNYLPFMVLPLYVCLEKFDFSLLEAARDLGASSFKVFTRVLLPMTKVGIATGFLLVFTPALGEFLIPDMLGGAQTMLIGNLIIDQFLKMRDWPFGSALSIILMVVVVVSLMITVRLWKDVDRSENTKQSA
jgi:spermidine/putrescine transport system permease protein